MISKINLIKPHNVVCSLSCLVLLSGCFEDEAQVRELRQLREKLTVAEKKAVEATQAAETASRELSEALNKSANKAADPGAGDRLRQSEQRVAELEARLAEAQKQSGSAAAKTPDSGGTFRDHARQVQQNLMEQMGTLSENLQARQSGPSLEEITVKKIQSGFRSEIVFSVRAGDQVRKLVFPVEADLDGHWNLPSSEVIASHLGNTPVSPSVPPPTLAQNPPPAAPPSAPSAPPTANAPASPLAATDTVVIQWDQQAGRPAVAPAAPAPSAPPPTASAPAAPPAGAPKAVPKPVMPVTRDVQIRFD